MLCDIPNNCKLEILEYLETQDIVQYNQCCLELADISKHRLDELKYDKFISVTQELYEVYICEQTYTPLSGFNLVIKDTILKFYKDTKNACYLVVNETVHSIKTAQECIDIIKMHSNKIETNFSINVLDHEILKLHTNIVYRLFRLCNNNKMKLIENLILLKLNYSELEVVEYINLFNNYYKYYIAEKDPIIEMLVFDRSYNILNYEIYKYKPVFHRRSTVNDEFMYFRQYHELIQKYFDEIKEVYHQKYNITTAVHAIDMRFNVSNQIDDIILDILVLV